MDGEELRESKRKTLVFVEKAKPYITGTQVDTKVFTSPLITLRL